VTGGKALTSGELLADRGHQIEVVAIGGGGLLLLGLIERSTKDLGLVGLVSGDRLVKPVPLPAALREAADDVGRLMKLSPGWLKELAPTADELRAAAARAITHDNSEGFRQIMTQETLSNMTLTMSALADLGYSKPAIADMLADLTMGGLVEKWRRGNRDHYELARVPALVALVGGVLPATAPIWSTRFKIVASLVSTEAATLGKKPMVQAVSILKQLEQHRHDLEDLGVRPPPHLPGWSDVASWARHALLHESRSEQKTGRSRHRGPVHARE
jgi:hypothetical protein